MSRRPSDRCPRRCRHVSVLCAQVVSWPKDRCVRSRAPRVSTGRNILHRACSGTSRRQPPPILPARPHPTALGTRRQRGLARRKPARRFVLARSVRHRNSGCGRIAFGGPNRASWRTHLPVPILRVPDRRSSGSAVVRWPPHIGDPDVRAGKEGSIARGRSGVSAAARSRPRARPAGCAAPTVRERTCGRACGAGSRRPRCRPCRASRRSCVPPLRRGARATA
jgi:hypothetical protein